jgi:hypothetical protein
MLAWILCSVSAIHAGLPLLRVGGDVKVPDYEELKPVPMEEFVSAGMLTNALFTVAPTAQPDGLHLAYTLKGPECVESITGTQSLAMRVSEIKGLSALDKIDNSEEFARAIMKAGAGKIESVKEAVKDPLGTVQRLPQGASRLLGRVATSVKNATEGNADPRAGAQAVLGIRRMKAELAARLGVSPYTTNSALQGKLDATARAMAGGALVVNLSGLAISGGVGSAISVVNVNQTLQRTLIESTPEEMTLTNRAALMALNATPPEVEGFLSNPSFSPWQKTILTADLKDLGQNPAPFLRIASRAYSPEEVLDLMQAVRILHKHHGDTAAVVSLRESDGVLAALDAKGALVAPVGADLILWMPPNESRARTLLGMAKEDARVKSVVLATDGLFSARAAEEFSRRGIMTIPLVLGPIN